MWVYIRALYIVLLIYLFIIMTVAHSPDYYSSTISLKSESLSFNFVPLLKFWFFKLTCSKSNFFERYNSINFNTHINLCNHHHTQNTPHSGAAPIPSSSTISVIIALSFQKCHIHGIIQYENF